MNIVTDIDAGSGNLQQNPSLGDTNQDEEEKVEPSLGQIDQDEEGNVEPTLGEINQDEKEKAETNPGGETETQKNKLTENDHPVRTITDLTPTEESDGRKYLETESNEVVEEFSTGNRKKETKNAVNEYDSTKDETGDVAAPIKKSTLPIITVRNVNVINETCDNPSPFSQQNIKEMQHESYMHILESSNRRPSETEILVPDGNNLNVSSSKKDIMHDPLSTETQSIEHQTSKLLPSPSQINLVRPRSISPDSFWNNSVTCDEFFAEDESYPNIFDQSVHLEIVEQSSTHSVLGTENYSILRNQPSKSPSAVPEVSAKTQVSKELLKSRSGDSPLTHQPGSSNFFTSENMPVISLECVDFQESQEAINPSEVATPSPRKRKGSPQKGFPSMHFSTAKSFVKIAPKPTPGAPIPPPPPCSEEVPGGAPKPSPPYSEEVPVLYPLKPNMKAKLNMIAQFSVLVKLQSTEGCYMARIAFFKEGTFIWGDKSKHHETLGKLFSDSNAWGNIEAHYSHQNPKRKSYDAVFININNRMVSALKHGTAMEVISSIEAGQSVFCTTTALSKTDSYFLNLKKVRWLVYSCLISGIQSELLKESKNVDLKLLISIVKRNITPSALNSEEMRQNLAESPSEAEDSNDIVIVKELNLAQEIIVLEEMCAKYPTLKVKEAVALTTCFICGKDCNHAIALLYHLSTSNKCKQMKPLKVVFQDTEKKIDAKISCKLHVCNFKHTQDLCSKKFRTALTYGIHRDSHINLNCKMSCWKCSHLFFAPYPFYRHPCVANFYSLKMVILQQKIFKVQYPGLAAQEVSTIITCPACGKSYRYLSALAGHISFNVNCALKLIRNSGRVSLDLSKCLLADRCIPIISRNCEICSLSCKSQVSYLAHMDHHFTGINYECSVCNFTFIRVCAFYKHTCHQPIPFCIFCEADKDAIAERDSHSIKTAENSNVLKVLQESSSQKQSFDVDSPSKKSDQQMKISKKHQNSVKDVALATNEIVHSSLQNSQTIVSNANTINHYGPSKLSFTTAGIETYSKYTSTSTHITSCGQATYLPLVNSTPIPALPQSFPLNTSSTLLTARIQPGLKRAGESLDTNPSKVSRIDIDKLFEESDSDDDEDSLVQLVIPTINQIPASNPKSCNKNSLAEFLSESEDSSNPESKSSQDPELRIFDDSGTMPKEDSGTMPEEDSGTMPEEDSGTMLEEDSRTMPEEDSGTMPEEDSGTKPDEDSGTMPEEDSGIMPEEDLGTMPEEDSGTMPEEDSGTMPEDDSGTMPEEDIGTMPEEDSGTMPEEDSETSSIEIGPEAGNYGSNDITDNDEILENLSDCYICHNCDPIQLLRGVDGLADHCSSCPDHENIQPVWLFDQVKVMVTDLVHQARYKEKIRNLTKRRKMEN